ncbi:restriction endonuclease subunit S [Methylicorpusculum oleiharenae]|uniref:restriction endonuclease subunit S n=1 Tax=Methylicorpusculum oleiharenae TaxID=1338687 RepID=UPI001358E7BE|nr:restriction endonuclease subunit S [Methylicorpusculum oleiharenae]MCD2453083.1 restriction endonuclease subunit S [Methylicorpusculum oleiharenae]
MIEQLAALPTYEAYKDSGVEWLGEIPDHWIVKRTKYLFTEINERSNNGIEDLLSVSQYTGVTKKSDKIEEGKLLTNAESLEGYKKVSKDDLVSNIMLAWNGSLGFSPFAGITSPAYSVYRLVTEDCKRYFHYLLRTDLYKAEYKRRSSGVIESRLRLYTEDFFNVWSLLPPNPEQTAIAAFLDRKTAQIDQAVAIKEQQIALLKEHKQILIQNAVTRGLDPNVPMRNSGVEWIGEIPVHWVVLANRALFRQRIEPGKEGLPLLSVSIHTAVSSEEISDEENIRGRIKIEDKTKYNMVQPGDIVFNMMRAWQGAIGAVAVKGMVSPAYIIATPNQIIVSSYFEYQYRCPEFIQQMDRYSKGITDFRKRLYWNEFKQLMTVVPSIEEQTAIVTHIETQSTKIDQAIAIQQQQITKLKEYKTTLINSAVTGKIRVPEVT